MRISGLQTLPRVLANTTRKRGPIVNIIKNYLQDIKAKREARKQANGVGEI